MNTDPGSISQWMLSLKSGNPTATHAIWERFYPKLVQAANKRLLKNPDPATSGEDIAQSSFRNVCLGVLEGKYPQLENRDDLWRLPMISMINRVRSHYRSINAQKRTVAQQESIDWIDDELLTELNSHEAQSQLDDLIDFLLVKLDQEDSSGELRQIALLYLHEHSASEIAKILHKRKTNILHKVQLIRSLWEESLLP